MGVVGERDAWAVLASVHGLGPATFGLLLREHGSALRVLELAATPAGRHRIRVGPRRDRDGLPIALVDALGPAAADALAIVERLATASVSF